MQPLQLSLKYIGPHKNTNIDFTILDDFFLIYGETGAGKTFIFDSIIHSIYGEPKKETYEERDKSLVSVNKPDNEIPSIEFTFSLGKAIYKVFRTLPYQKSTKKTKENATASLHIFNAQQNSFEQIENEVDSINEKLQNLIGLTKEEFKKIVILPQGEFQKFLKMTPKDKKDFLTKVFKNTQIFSNIKQKVSKDVKEEESRIKLLEEELLKKCNSIDYENAQTNLENTQKEIAKLTEDQKSLIQKQNEFSATIKELEIKTKAAFEYKQNLENLKKLEAQTEKINEDKKKIQQATEAQKLEKFYALKKQSEKEKIDTENELQNTKILLTNKQEENKHLVLKYFPEENVETSNDDVVSKLMNYQIQNEKDLGCFNAQLQVAKENEKLNEQVAQHRENLNTIDKECQKYLEQKNTLTLFSKKNYAFYLAQNLQENEACPVCGSKTHPVLAEKPVQTEEETLLLKAHKTLEDAIQNAETLLNQKLAEQNKLQTQISEKSLLIEKNKTEFTVEQLMQKIQQTKQNVENTKNVIQNCKNLKEEIATLSGKIEATTEKLKKLSEQFNNAKTEFEANLTTSPFKTEQEMLFAILSQSDFNFINEKIKNWESNYNQVQGKLNSAITTEDYADLQQKLSQKKSESTQVGQTLNSVNEKLRTKEEYSTIIKNTVKEIETQKQEIEELNKNLKPLKLLHTHLSGRPAIDTWATKLYFENILDFANKRFKEITNGTYKFIFGKSSKEGVSEEDIDISVYDKTTNIIRHCSSLSGGEEFLASISLALGLADAIQCQNTNAIIESMFIDEGFGSLGIEVQNRAVEVLKKLNDTRKIGIISHSENLKEEIDCRLSIEKENGISSVQIYSRNTLIM